jgi:AcrR family transcriptional regulator
LHPSVASAVEQDGAELESATPDKTEDGSKSPAAECSTAERLVDTAGRIFAAKGIEATVREICKEAGCSVAAINYYFGDKNQLYLHCVQTACERKQKLFPLPDVADVPPANAAEALRAFLKGIICRIAASTDEPDSSLAWQNMLMLREVLAPSPGVSDMLREPFGRDFQALDCLIVKLLGEDPNLADVRQDLLTQILARCMFLKTGVNLRNMLALNTNNNEDPQLYADRICDSILMQINVIRRAGGQHIEGWSVENNKSSMGVE